MRLNKFPLFILMLAAYGTANAGLVGNLASVNAEVSVTGDNNTTVDWQQRAIKPNGLTAQGVSLGVLKVTATGTHDSLSITGEGATKQGSTVVLPFTSTDGNSTIYGRIQNVNGTANSGIKNLPGWSVPYSLSKQGIYSVEFKAHGVYQNVNPGVYSANIYVQQWQN
ncbi:TPA: hypothetical protein JLT77_004619 [Escherichia coli]|nr:hypothetical protein [Escherichia coli]